MKKIIALISCLFLLAGCNNYKNDYDQLVKENNELKNQIEYIINNLNENRKELEELKKQNEKYDVRISGGEVFTVEDKLVDKTLEPMKDSPKPLLVRRFQGNLEVIYVPEEIAKQVKKGKTYFFEISPQIFEDTTIEDAYKQFEINHIVTSIRTPKEDEFGLADTLFAEKVK